MNPVRKNPLSIFAVRAGDTLTLYPEYCPVKILFVAEQSREVRIQMPGGEMFWVPVESLGRLA
jgi:hypothetical protein